MTKTITVSTILLAGFAFAGNKYFEYTKVVDYVQQAAKRTTDYKYGDMEIKTSIECSPSIFGDGTQYSDNTILFQGKTVRLQYSDGSGSVYKFKLIENDYYVYEEIVDNNYNDKNPRTATVYKDRIEIGYSTYNLYNCSMKN